jgi:subtilisin family serine protease
MKQIRSGTFLSLTTLVFSVLVGVSYSGEIEPALKNRLQTLPAMEFMSVWIKLPRPKGQERLSVSLESSLTTQEDRYAVALNRLKTDHGNSQESLLGYLRGMESAGRVRNIKPHWIANIVEADIAANDLVSLAAHPSVEIVAERPVLVSIDPDKDQSLSLAATVGDNLKLINADDAWLAGFNGAGRLVCSFDTGINGLHAALQSKWKGSDGDSAAAWFDPVYHLPAPHIILGSAHGTHVMGIMVGSNAADTVGVAIGAKWISAGVVDVPGASLLDAFEWAANPDGDPNTISDVPDVINHSWGMPSVGCTDLWFDAIENCEALGIVNIFAAGNEGPTTSSMRNPAVRANDSLDCFAVGNVNSTLPLTIANLSSRGPSTCPFGAIKPNVVAPGQGIRSCGASGYVLMSGTSMSAPHVSGLVALLRQKNPNATVNQIKTAILNTAADHGNPLPNTTFGWGAIDCMAALNALANNSGSSLKMYAFDHNAVIPSATVRGKVTLQNAGTTVLENCQLSITGSNPSITVVDGTCSFGQIVAGATKLSTDSISVVISDTVTEGSILAISATLSATGYSRQQTLYFAVEPALTRSFATTSANRIDVTLSNFGTYGCDDNSWYPLGQIGFRVDGFPSDWYECGLIAGTDASHISDGIRNLAAEFDGDFAISPGGNMALSAPGEIANEETHARFNDSRAENPVGLDIIQQSYQFTTTTRDDFVILRYILRNTSGGAVSNLRFGLYMDWDINVYSLNRGAWESTEGLLWGCYASGSISNRFRGSAVIDGTTATAFTSSTSLVSFPGGFTESEKYGALFSGFATAEDFRGTSADICQILAAGPISLSAGASDTIAFALLIGDSLTHIQSALVEAKSAYSTRVSCCRNFRGNMNNDGADAMNIVDVTFFVAYLFHGGSAPVCFTEADANADESLNIVDLTYIINYMYKGGLIPPDCP